MPTLIPTGLAVSLFDAVQQTEFDEWKEVRLYETNQHANAGSVYREM